MDIGEGSDYLLKLGQVKNFCCNVYYILIKRYFYTTEVIIRCFTASHNVASHINIPF